MAPSSVKVTAYDAAANADHICKAMRSSGLSYKTDYLTIFQTGEKKFLIQCVSEEAKNRVIEKCSVSQAAKNLFRIHVKSKSIMITRCYATLSKQELENMLFPPILGKVSILSRSIETKTTTDGDILFHTGRRFYTLPADEFERVKNIIPTFLIDPLDGNKMHVNFEGSQQQCFKCNSREHLIATCPAIQSEVVHQGPVPSAPPAPVTKSTAPVDNRVAGFIAQASEASSSARVNNRKKRGNSQAQKRKQDPAGEPESKRDNSNDEEAPAILLDQSDLSDQPSLDAEKDTDPTLVQWHVALDRWNNVTDSTEEDYKKTTQRKEDNDIAMFTNILANKDTPKELTDILEKIILDNHKSHLHQSTT